MCDFFKPPMCPLERLVLNHGQDFKPAKRPNGLRKQANKMCFRNATHLSRTGLRYVEGYAVHDGLIDDDTVVDPTWRRPERSRYRGIVIPQELMLRTMARTRVYGVLDYGMINFDAIEQLSGGTIKRPEVARTERQGEVNELCRPNGMCECIDPTPTGVQCT